jgi:excisionase family DNA binding protein
MKYDKELPEYLTLMEVSQLLKVHPNTLRNWEKDGVLIPAKIGLRNLRRYRRDDIEKFMEKNNEAAEQAKKGDK